MKKFFLLIVIIFYSNIYALTISELYNKANSYYFNRDYINAVQTFRQILNDYPASSYSENTLFGLGSSYYELGNYRDAITIYSQLVEEFPNSNYADDALFRIGECYENIAEFKNANTYYAKIINEYPQSLLFNQAKEKINKFSKKVFTNTQSKKLPSKNINLNENSLDKLIQNHKKIKKNLIPEKKIRKVIEQKYVVRPEDTLTKIAEKFYGDFNLYTRIAEHNNLENPTQVHVGQTLLIPVIVEETISDNNENINKNFSNPTPNSNSKQIDFNKANDFLTASDPSALYYYKLDQEKENFQKQLAFEMQKRKNLLKKMRGLEEQIQKLKIDIETYKNNLQSLQDIKFKIDELKKNNNQLIENLKLLKQKDVIREAKNKSEILNIKHEFDELLKKYTQLKNDNSVNEYKKIIEQKDLQLKTEQLKNTTLNNQINSLNSQLQITSQKNNLQNAQISNLTKKIEHLEKIRSDILTYQKKLVDTKNQLTSALDKNKKSNIQINQLKLDNLKLEKANSELNLKIEEFSEKSDNLIADLNSTSSEKNALNNKLASMSIKNNDLTSQNAELKNQLNSMKKKVDEITQKNKKLSLQLASLNEKNQKNENFADKYLKDSEKKLSAKTQKIDELSLQVTNLRKQLDLYTTKFNNLTSQKKELNTKAGQQTNQINELSRINEELNNKIKILENKLNNYAQNSSSSNMKIGNLSNKLKAYENQLDSIKKQLDLSQNENSILKNQVATLNESNKKLIDDLNSINKNSESQSSHLNQTIAQLQKKLELTKKEYNKKIKGLKNKPKPTIQKQNIQKKELKKNTKDTVIAVKKQTVIPFNELIQKGIMANQKKQFKKAEKYFLAALKQNPDAPETYNYLGLLYCNTNKNIQKGIDFVNTGIDKGPADIGYYFDTLGWLHFKKNNFKNAVKYLKIAISNKPKNDINAVAQMYYHLGLAYKKIKDSNNAFFQFIEVLKLIDDQKNPIVIETKKQLELL